MNEIIVLDIETTGLDNQHDSIIEIAAVKLKDFQVVGSWQTLVRPTDSSLNATVAQLTGISEQDLQSARELADIKAELLAFVGDCPIVGHNISFDLEFLKAKALDLSGDSLDTLELAHTLLPKLRFYSLEFLAYYYNFINQPSHRAMADVLATVELCQLLINRFNQLTPDLKQQIKALNAKVNWEWSFIFDVQLNFPAHQPIGSRKNAITVDLSLPQIGELKFKTGFNVLELPLSVLQIPFNLALTALPAKSILVVNHDNFANLVDNNLNLEPFYPSHLQLDKAKFNFLLQKTNLNTSELKLAIKILIAEIGDEFNPKNIYLTKDEFYLFDQKLSQSDNIQPKLGDSMITDFAGIKELLNWGNLPPDYSIFIPQWVEFDEWWLDSNIKTITSAYLNAVVSHRRDFVHDFVSDNKLSDQLFKILNNLGAHLVMTMALFGLIWQEQQHGPISTLELETGHLNTQNGSGLKDNLRGIVDLLNEYLAHIRDLPIQFPLILEQQIKHTADLIDYLGCLINPDSAYKIFIDAPDNYVLVRVIKSVPANLWQTKLKPFKTIIASNGVTVDGKTTFVSSILGEQIKTEPLNFSAPANPTEIIWVRDLIKSSPSADYEESAFAYLRQWIENDLGKLLIVMPTAKMTTDFFNQYQPIIPGANLISRDVIGNADTLNHKLQQLSKFTLVIGYYNLQRWLPAIANLDRVILVKFAFDRLGKSAQLLAEDRFGQAFSSYALPKAIVDFKLTLAELSAKAPEIWVLDPRLQFNSYGKTVKSSLNGFTHSEVKAEY